MGYTQVLLMIDLFTYFKFKTPTWVFVKTFFFFFCPSLLLLLLLVITFLPPHCHYFHSTTTNKRTNERTNERTLTLPVSLHVRLLLTVNNFLPFASFLFLLTLDRLRR
jgi:hypothetical protein